MNVPFYLPLIDDRVVAEMNDTLLNTGWLTTGPKVMALEAELKKLTTAEQVLCVNSWNSGTTLMLRWFGIKAGDEIIIPAYTYSATALAAINLGAKVIMVDIGNDFNIDVKKIEEAITEKTKAILPVDLGGFPCDYDEINEIVNKTNVKAIFKAESENQEKLGRILVIADAAHSIGAFYKGKESGILTDISVFSFHSVKNITTGEGGAVCLNLPQPFNNEKIYKYLKHFHLYGQTKSALDKTKIGKWRYDIVSPGMKTNMPDINAAVGLSQIRRYTSELLPERKAIFQQYNEGFKQYDWAELPPYKNSEKVSSCHLYMLRIKNISETQRDQIVDFLSKVGVGFSVHYIPMATLTLFKSMGYNIDNYPMTYNNYSREISLPIYNGLKSEQVQHVISSIIQGYEFVTKKRI